MTRSWTQRAFNASVVMAINTSDAPSVKLLPTAFPDPPPYHHFYPLMYVKLAVMVLDYKECTQLVHVSFSRSEISLQLSVILVKKKKKKSTHLTHSYIRTHSFQYSLYTSGCERLCWCEFSSVHCCLIESFIVSNDPRAFLLFHPDQRAKSCCEDENRSVSLWCFLQSCKMSRNML